MVSSFYCYSKNVAYISILQPITCYQPMNEPALMVGNVDLYICGDLYKFAFHPAIHATLYPLLPYSVCPT